MSSPNTHSSSKAPTGELGFVLDVQTTPRLELLYTTCSTGISTIARLLPHHYQTQAAEASSRLTLWGLDLFKAEKIHLDRALENHGTLKHHLLGVLADAAAILEIMLSTLIEACVNSAEPQPEGAYHSLRRVRIALSQNDILSALTDNEWAEGLFDDPSAWVKNCLDNLNGLIDCLYDNLLSISIASKVEHARLHPSLLSNDITISSELEDGRSIRKSNSPADAVQEVGNRGPPQGPVVGDTISKITQDSTSRFKQSRSTTMSSNTESTSQDSDIQAYENTTIPTEHSASSERASPKRSGPAVESIFDDEEWPSLPLLPARGEEGRKVIFGWSEPKREGMSEMWDDDFEFDESLPSAEQVRVDRSPSGGIVVPKEILEKQSMVHGQFGLVKELSLLVEELRRLRHQAGIRGIMSGDSSALWNEAEAIINLVTLDEDEPMPTSDRYLNFSSPSSVSIPTRTRHKRSSALFDITSLRDLVTRAGVLTRALKEIIRKTEDPSSRFPEGIEASSTNRGNQVRSLLNESTKTLAPKKTKGRRQRKGPHIAGSNAGDFGIEVASAVDDAGSSESEEVFVYEPAPSELHIEC